MKSFGRKLNNKNPCECGLPSYIRTYGIKTGNACSGCNNFVENCICIPDKVGEMIH
jgi:hypothetical protein